MTSERNVVQSLNRVLSILDVLIFAESDLELREIAGHTRLPKSTAHRLLATLELRGYATRHPETGKYRLALRVFRSLGSGQQIREILFELARRSRETANLGVLTGADITYVARADSPHALRWQLGIGSRVPAHCSALGKSILAQMSRDTIRKLLPARLSSPTINALRNWDALLAELETIRSRGHALDNQEFMEGVRCVAMPIWETAGRAAGALSPDQLSV
jgi:IclR family KDG regulon transcriptional repressor